MTHMGFKAHHPGILGKPHFEGTAGVAALEPKSLQVMAVTEQ